MPIILSEFEQSLEDVTFPLAVAVSGGPDSLALLLLAHELAQKKGSHVIALTVDHGLRPESKEEAQRVHKWAQMRGIEHITLNWVDEKPTSRLQERARQARYDLLIKWCQENQISTLLLGHHQQDQEETFWLRLSAGSGLTGLSGIKKCTSRDGVLLLRPLLDFSKERIKETLVAAGQEWIEDPSNQNSRFFRGRLRQFLSEEGLSSDRLDQVIQKFQRDADFIQGVVNKTLQEIVKIHNEGYLSVKKDSFYQLHPAIQQRVLSYVMQWFSNAAYAPRTAQVMGVMDKLKRESSFTAGGIYWAFSDEGIFLFREKRAVKEAILVHSLKEKTLWDQRFWIDLQLKEIVPEGLVAGALGQGKFNKEAPSRAPIGGVVIQKNHGEKLDCDGAYAPRNDDLGSYAKYILPTLPALWLKGTVVAVPHLCYDALECGEDIRKFFSLKPLFHDSLRFTI